MAALTGQRLAARAPFMVLASLAAMGLSLKLGRVWGIADGAGEPALLQLWPFSVGKDLVTAGLLAALVWLLTRPAPRTGAGFGVVAFGVIGFFSCGNAISYALTQAPLTLQRLRGDEGADLGDLGLLEWADWLPGATVVFTALLAAAIAWYVAGRVRQGTTLVWMLVAVVGGAGLEGARLLRPSALLDRLAETPMGVMGASVMEELRPDARLPRPASRYPRKLSGDAAAQQALWREIETPTTAPHTPARPPHKQAGHKKNVVIFLAETLSFKHSSFGGIEDSTPNLERRAAGGLLMTRAYSPYCLSIQAIYGVSCSDWPVPDGINIAGVNPRIDCGELSQSFAQDGVQSGLFHAGNFGFYDKLAFLGRRAYSIEKDAQALASERFDSNKWGIDDAAMVDAMLGWVDTLPGEQRFMAMMIPISAHYPYEAWEGHERRFPGSSKKQRYLSSVAYLDETFERMMKGLEDRGVLQDTAVILVGDHGESQGEQVHESTGNRLSYETHAHVPMVVIAPDVVPAQTSDRVVGLMDVGPTARDLLGLAPDPRHHGRSIFADDWQDRRVFLGAMGDGIRLVGFVDHDTKFLVDMRSWRAELYDLHADPHELVNLAAQRPQDVSRYTEVALAWRDWQNQRLRNAPTLGDEINLHDGAMKDATITLTDASGTRTCAPAACGPSMVRATARVQRRSRDCFVLDLPDDGSVTLSASGTAWVKEISQLRVALLDGEKTTPRITLTGISDGHERTDKLAGRGTVKRLELVRPKDSIEVTVKTDGDAPRLCLTLGETAWRNTHERRAAARRTAALDAGPVDPGPVAPAPDDDDDDQPGKGDADDEHAAAVRGR